MIDGTSGMITIPLVLPQPVTGCCLTRTHARTHARTHTHTHTHFVRETNEPTTNVGGHSRQSKGSGFKNLIRPSKQGKSCD